MTSARSAAQRPPHIAVEALRYRYRRGADELFGGLDYQFTPGVLTAVTGASGRGKSTLLYLLGLMLRPTDGSVSIDGSRVDHLPDVDRSQIRARRLGFVFQDAALDPARPVIDSVIEPALYAGRRSQEVRARAGELLETLGVAIRSSHRPGEISGGQAQRVAVARALVNDPSVILADEPTGNLDEANTALVLDALAGSTRTGKTVVLATHDPRVVERADVVLEL